MFFLAKLSALFEITNVEDVAKVEKEKKEEVVIEDPDKGKAPKEEKK